MDLVVKSLNVFRDSQVGLKLLDVVGTLVFGRQQAQRDLDLLGICGIDHGRVALDGSFELRLRRGSHERDDLAAPAETDDAPGLDVGIELLDLLHKSRDPVRGLRGSASGGEELP